MPVERWHGEPLSGTVCPTCRAEQRFGTLVCARCGARLAAWVPAEALASGMPVARYNPSHAGPPIPAAAQPRRMTTPDVQARPAIRPPKWPVALPAPTPPPGPRNGRPVATVAALLLVALGVGALLLRGAIATSARMPASPGATTTPAGQLAARAGACAPPPAAPAGMPVGDLQMALALVDARTGDYRPRQPATTVPAGQPAYLTFRVATAVAGQATIRLCTPQSAFEGALAIPAGSQGRYVAFPASFDVADRGPCLALVYWDGRPVASARFAVVE